jgi:hypothetical protein
LHDRSSEKESAYRSFALQGLCGDRLEVRATLIGAGIPAGREGHRPHGLEIRGLPSQELRGFGTASIPHSLSENRRRQLARWL